MIDPRMHKLADVLVNYSIRLQAGDKVLVEASDMPDDMTCETLRAVVSNVRNSTRIWQPGSPVCRHALGRRFHCRGADYRQILQLRPADYRLSDET